MIPTHLLEEFEKLLGTDMEFEEVNGTQYTQGYDAAAEKAKVFLSHAYAEGVRETVEKVKEIIMSNTSECYTPNGRSSYLLTDTDKVMLALAALQGSDYKPK